MKGKTPEIITFKHLIPDYHGPNGILVRWYVQLPSGPLVFVGEMEDEVRTNLNVLNKLAQMCQTKWRGVVELSVSKVEDFL